MAFLAKLVAGIAMFFSSLFGLHQSSVLVIISAATSSPAKIAIKNSTIGFQWSPIGSATSSLYKIENGQVHFVGGQPGDIVSDQVVDGADANSFSVSLATPRFGRDQNHLYFAGDVVKIYGPEYDNGPIGEPDPATLTNLGDTQYWEDKNNVYLSDEASNSILFVVSGANPKTFVLIAGTGIGKDASQVYWGGQIVDGMDPNTLVFLSSDDEYVKDKHGVWFAAYGDEQIPVLMRQADSQTFQVVSGGSSVDYDAWDKNHKYLRGEIVQ